MFIFKAYYTDMVNNEDIVREISFQEAISDRDAYLLATAKAYDMKKENETLDMLELIAC